MNCRKIKANLEEYLDGALADNEKTVFERHLRDCAECRSIYEERLRLGDRLTSAMTGMAGGLETPPGMVEAIARGVRHSKRRPVMQLIRRSKLAAAAALPAAALVLLLIFVPRGDDRKETGGSGDQVAGSYLELTTTRHGVRSQDPWTVKRVYLARSNGDHGFLSLELVRDSKSLKEKLR
jgi:predicted anti-sigma-YlaC factor YlaD